MSAKGLSPAAQSFVLEAEELLEALERQLLELEGTTASGSGEQVDAVFRALHTVKGSGSMFGFDRLARFTHDFETAFDAVREGRLMVNSALVDLSLKARDEMLALLASGPDGTGAEADPGPTARSLSAELAALTGGAASLAAPAPTEAGGGASTGPLTPVTYDIHFKPAEGSLRQGMRPELLLNELRELGDVTIEVEAESLPPLDVMDPTLCHIGWHAVLTTAEPRATIEAVFIFADDAELSIEARAKEATDNTASKEDAPGVPAAEARTDDAPPAEADATAAAAGARAPQRAEAAESVRVPALRLDEMMDQLGELVIAQSRLRQVCDRLADPALISVVEEVERFITGLRDTTLSLRMLPIEVVFGKFRRVVRDLSTTLGKDVRLVTRGGETEIDKNVIDRLSEPLVHMIRNAMDHGVETAEERREAGKPTAATVTLEASQQGGEVLITVSDDGRGLDTEAIRLKAVERGLLAPEERPNDAAINELIFAPGFSTASTLSNVSGRGVGMDAVRTAVEGLRGKIAVDTKMGQGTRITLHMPVTLAIIDGFLVRVGSSVFVLPLAAVEECTEFAPVAHESGRRMIELREHLVAYLDLAELFGTAAGSEEARRVVIVRAGGRRLGLVVDDILGQNQTVIKPLSVYHKNIEGIAGATILGDGAVALILDVAGIAVSAGGPPPLGSLPHSGPGEAPRTAGLAA
ncbi:MAG: chemotaxis protein CheA [Pseudomonadota bacterium]